MTATAFASGFIVCVLMFAAAFAIFFFLWLRSEDSPTEPLAFFRVVLGPKSYIEGVEKMRLTTEQRTLLTVVALTAAGNPAAIDGDVSFSTSDESVARIDVIDATNAYVTAVGPGAAQIFATFDADLGEGVRTIELSGAIEVVPAEAERGELVFGEPELIPQTP